MDADDLARGRALEAAASEPPWDLVDHGPYCMERREDAEFTAWLRNNAVPLLDAAERAARLEAALRSRSFPQEDWGRIELALKCVVRNDMVDSDVYGAYDALYERVKAINRAALERPKGVGDE